MITEIRRCGDVAGDCMILQLTSVETTDFSKLLNDSLYATTFLAYGTRRQCCPNCLLPDHSAEDCALYNPWPMTKSGIAPIGRVMIGGYEWKEENGIGNRVEKGPVLPGMTESVWHNAASMTLRVQSIMETTRGPHAQLSWSKIGETIEVVSQRKTCTDILCDYLSAFMCNYIKKWKINITGMLSIKGYYNMDEFTFTTITISIYIP